MLIVDAHEDIAWSALTFSRDYTTSAHHIRASEAGSDTPAQNGSACLGRKEWISGKVGVIFATLFVSPYRRRLGAWDHMCYRDADEAYRLARKQLDYYLRLENDNSIWRIIRNRADLNIVTSSWERGAENRNLIGITLLMEGADPIRTPDDVANWQEQGVRIIGPAWAGTRYCGGTGDPGPLTSVGEELLENMSDCGIILDVSHMSERSFDQAVERYESVIIASHANPRFAAELSTPERGLTDDQIRKLADRDGVIGIIPYNRFLRTGWHPIDGKQTVDVKRVAETMDYICQLTGSNLNVGIGSDFDGGFGTESIPHPMDSVADLHMIGEALAKLNYEPEQITQMLSGNWLTVMQRGLPD
mgnify:CR=1 FL=1